MLPFLSWRTSIWGRSNKIGEVFTRSQRTFWTSPSHAQFDFARESRPNSRLHSLCYSNYDGFFGIRRGPRSLAWKNDPKNSVVNFPNAIGKYLFTFGSDFSIFQLSFDVNKTARKSKSILKEPWKKVKKIKSFSIL